MQSGALPQVPTVSIKTGWLPPAGAPLAPLSVTPGHYDWGNLRTIIDGRQMPPDAALQAVHDQMAGVLGQVPADHEAPIPGSLRIVIPDHDRLRVVAIPGHPSLIGGVVDFDAENLRISLHGTADLLVRERVFANTTIVEQNDTQTVDPHGADYVLWYKVAPLAGNPAGLWTGQWLLRKASGAAVLPVSFDPGTPLGPQRLHSFATSARDVAHRLNGMPSVGGGGLPPDVASIGSGIAIDSAGHILTDNHVVATCKGLRVSTAQGVSEPAAVVAADAANDLALIKSERPSAAWARFRDSHGLRPGEAVVVTGFPLSGLVSREMAVTTGSVTALAGMRGDSRQIEISAPVQPGNSGGPVLDGSGRVIGVTTAVLNSLLVAAATGGSLPQNVNFATKTEVARTFLDAHGIALDQGTDQGPMSAPAIGDLARGFTVRIECLR